MRRSSLLAVVCVSSVFALSACGKKEKAPAAPVVVATAPLEGPVEVMDPVAPLDVQPLNIRVPVLTPVEQPAVEPVAASEPTPVAETPAPAADPAAPAAASVLACTHGTVTEVETNAAGETIATATRCKPAPRPAA